MWTNMDKDPGRLEYVAPIFGALLTVVLARFIDWSFGQISAMAIMANTGVASYLNVALYLVIYALTGWTLLWYYNKVYVVLGYNILKLRMNPLRRFFRTYAMWGRFACLIVLALSSIWIVTIRPLALIYSLYFSAILYWSTASNYRFPLYMILRASIDFGLACVATFQYGGIVGPICFLFMIPFCSVSRNHSRNFAMLWCLLTIGVVLCIGWLQFELSTKLLPSILTQFFKSEGPYTNMVLGASATLTFCLFCLLIGVIFEIERRQMFFPMLKEIIEMRQRDFKDIAPALKFAVDKVDCAILLYLSGTTYCYAINGAMVNLSPNISNADLSDKKNNFDKGLNICKQVNICARQKGLNLEQISRTKQIDNKLLDDIKKMLIPDKLNSMEIYSTELVSFNETECLIAINQFAYNRIAVHDFSPQSVCRLNMFAGKLNRIASSFEHK